MSRSPFVITFLVCGTLVGWLYLSQETHGREVARPGGARPLSHVFGYPDNRGILLELRDRSFADCSGGRFRSESPDFVVWDDGTVVFRTSTYDYRKAKVSASQARAWSRTFQAYSARPEAVACESAGAGEAGSSQLWLWGRRDGVGTTLTVLGLPASGLAHTESCDDCRPLRPLAAMLGEIDARRRQGDGCEPLNLPVEVYLEWRSCGCRNHPEIVAVSKSWPLSGARPSAVCGKGSTRIRLEDPAEIRALSDALFRSAAVLDGGEIYTCFMRPLMEFSHASGPLARH